MADRTFAVPRALALSARQGQAPANAPEEPVLDMNDIQGNSLVGFNKDHQAFLFLRFGPAENARQWVKQLAPRVATAEELLGDRRLFRELRGRRGRDAGN